MWCELVLRALSTMWPRARRLLLLQLQERSSNSSKWCSKEVQILAIICNLNYGNNGGFCVHFPSQYWEFTASDNKDICSRLPAAAAAAAWSDAAAAAAAGHDHAAGAAASDGRWWVFHLFALFILWLAVCWLFCWRMELFSFDRVFWQNPTMTTK